MSSTQPRDSSAAGAVGSGRSGEGRIDQSPNFLSSTKARLFIWTVEYVVLAQIVLFVVLLSVFERYQLEHATEKSDLIGQLAVRMLDDDVGGTDAVNQALTRLRSEYGIRPLSYRETGNARKLLFPGNELSGKETVSANVDLANLGVVDFFLNAFSRLFQSGDGVVVFSNADQMRPVQAEGDGNDVVLRDFAISAATLRSGTIDFIVVYFLQASVLMMVVAVLMYITGNRQIARPLQRVGMRVSNPADDPAGDFGSRATGVEEIRNVETEIVKLMKRIRIEGFKAFVKYRSAVEHDVKEDLVTHQAIARMIGRETDMGRVADIVDRLTEMQRQTREFLHDAFDFWSVSDRKPVMASLGVRDICANLLGRNVHLRTVGFPTVWADIDKLLVAKAILNVPDELCVRSNEAALTSAIQNLIRNSVWSLKRSGRKSSHDDWPTGVIEITAQEDREEVVISIRDNGHGFSAKMDEEGEVDGDRDGSPARRWGIGLKIVEEMMRRLGGRMEIPEEPVPPHGSETAGAEVRLVLPVDAGAQEAAAAAS